MLKDFRLSDGITIRVRDREGQQEVINDVPIDMQLNLMEVLRSSGFPVEGTCGGMALCASCHVYIKSDHVLPERTMDEEAMLSEINFVEENSRLGCQIAISKEIDQLEIEIAPKQ